MAMVQLLFVAICFSQKREEAMAQKQIVMEQLKQILQLKSDGVAIREIARRVGISRNSVRKYLLRLDTDEIEQSDNKRLAVAAYTSESFKRDTLRQEQLMKQLQLAKGELTGTGVTRQLLWQEYINKYPDGYSYSQYCHHLQQYLKHADRAMHMEYEPGDIMMIDFAGDKQRYVDPTTGEVIACEVFVAILPFSGLIFCHSVPTQQLPDFITCINAMLRFYRGVPTTLLCDNLKTAVVRTDRYEPQFTDLCYQLSEHYQTSFSATRPYNPRDKAMVESAVKIVYAHVYAPLRKQNFTSMEDLNTAMHNQLLLLNNKPYKHTPYSRWYYFEQQELQFLKPLPTEPFSSKKVVTLTVQRNYHVQLSEDHLYFSVPYQFVGKKVKVMYDKRTVEVYCNHERIALHIRKLPHKAYTTQAEHMPPNHAHMLEVKGWKKEELLAKAQQLGTAVHQAAVLILDNNFYVEQNYKACFGLLMLDKKYGTSRLEAACNRALTGSRLNYTMIKNILERGLDKQPFQAELFQTPEHTNIRGAEHYQ
jgi:transposase